MYEPAKSGGRDDGLRKWVRVSNDSSAELRNVDVPLRPTQFPSCSSCRRRREAAMYRDRRAVGKVEGRRSWRPLRNGERE